MNIRSKQGFTLVEIMIVVVIIGLLAAMAIPAFQKVRANSMEKALLNDGRQIGAAIQQYCMEYGVDQVAGVSFAANGLITHTGGFTAYLRSIAPGTTVAGNEPLEADANNSFTLQKTGAFGGVAAQFNGEGKKTN